MKEILNFLKSPHYIVSKQELNLSTYLKVLYFLLISELLILFVINTVLNILFNFDVIVLTNTTFSTIDLFTILLLAPIFEELIFRHPLKFNLFSIVNSVLIIILVPMVLFKINTLNEALILYFITQVIVNFFAKEFKYENKIKKFYIKHYKYFFWLFASIFGLLHLNQFEFNIQNFSPIIILATPYIFGGLYLGYVRLMYGLRYSMLLHANYNLIGVLAALFFK